MHDCTCNQGRGVCHCGKTMNQKNSDGSDPNVAEELAKLGNEPPLHWAVQALAIAVAAMAVSMLAGFTLGAAARHLGWF